MAFTEKSLDIVEAALPSSDKPMRAGLIAERARYAPSTVRDILRELIRQGRADKSGEGAKRVYFRKPD